MDERSLELILGAVTDQQYMFYLLVKILIEKGVLSNGEVLARYDQKERFHFGHDVLQQLVSNGLKISADHLSSSPTEPSSAPQRATTGEVDPEFGTKS